MLFRVNVPTATPYCPEEAQSTQTRLLSNETDLEYSFQEHT